MTAMKIGELAAASHTGVETIRYYEREGLLPEPARTESNYRSYGEDHLRRLQFVRYCRGLDMSLDEIRVLLSFKDSPHANCGDVNAVLDEHIGHVSRRIKELRALEKELKELRAQCGEVREAQDCGILEGLARASKVAKKTSRQHLKGVHGPA
jgi:Cd(II)/Pb(II)-responsive transcriptional regulator